MQFTNKQIWQITYPVLISLLMEHMIGLTDTAYLGRVGEVELGASALAGVYYLVIYMLGFGFSVGAQVLIARRNGGLYARDTFSVVTCGGFIYRISFVFSVDPSETDRFGRCISGYHELCRLACVWLFLLFYCRHVQGVLCGYHQDKDIDCQLSRDGIDQCCPELYPDIR